MSVINQIISRNQNNPAPPKIRVGQRLGGEVLKGPVGTPTAAFLREALSFAEKHEALGHHISIDDEFLRDGTQTFTIVAVVNVLATAEDVARYDAAMAEAARQRGEKQLEADINRFAGIIGMKLARGFPVEADLAELKRLRGDP